MISWNTDIFDDFADDDSILAYCEEYVKKYEDEKGFIKVDLADLYCVTKESELIIIAKTELDWMGDKTELAKKYLKSLRTMFSENPPGILLTITFADEIDTTNSLFGSIEQFTSCFSQDMLLIFGIYTDSKLWKNRARIRAVIGGSPKNGKDKRC